MTIEKKEEEKVFYECGVCNIKDGYGNGYLNPIEFKFHFFGCIQRRYTF